MSKYLKFAIILFSLISVLLFYKTASAAESFKDATASQFEVSPVFCDNMVLQQNEPIRIWGTSDCEGEIVNARLGTSMGSSAVKDGKWEVVLAERTYSSEPLVLEVYGGAGSSYTTFENVTIGDVWWIAGQSNVEYSLSASPNGNEFINLLSGNENIKLYQIGYKSFSAPSQTRWRKMNKYSSYDFSALGCYFAKHLDDSFNSEVPIGVVSLGFSGCELASFMPPELTDYVSFEIEKNKIYNSAINPIINMPIKGLIWYQGESDARIYSDYGAKLKSFISFLREKKSQNNHDFPVYAIELPPCFSDANDSNRQFIDFGNVRGETGALTYQINKFHVCPTSDLWNNKSYSNSLHPQNKLEISNRLALMVLSKEYGFGSSDYYFGPSVDNVDFSQNTLKISFKNCGEGLKYDNFNGFTVIGENWDIIKDFKIALTGANEITISSDQNICIVRYNTETDNIFGEDVSLRNSFGIPVCSFSIDISPPLLPRYPRFNIAEALIFAIMILAFALILKLLIKICFARFFKGRIS